MAQAHVIETLGFDIGFRTEEEAWDRHERLGDFARGRALAVIAEVFDEFSDDDHVLRLDRLELDLGAPADGEWTADLEGRLRKTLRLALEEVASAQAFTRPTAEVSAVTAAAADLQRLWGLIDLGRLPWQAGRTRQDDLDRLTARVLARDGEALARALREAPDLPRLIARIARQWSPEHLEQLTRLLAQARGETSPPPPAAQDAAAWERTLARAAAGPDHELDRDAATRSAARRAFGASLQAGRIAPRVWADLLRVDPDALSAILRDQLGAAGPSGLAGTLTADQFRDLLARSVPANDREAILAWTADPSPWRTDADRPLDVVSRALRESLIAHLLTAGGERIGAADTVAALVRALSVMEQRPVPEVAAALARRWPQAGAAAAFRPRLALILGDLAETSDEAARQAAAVRLDAAREASRRRDAPLDGPEPWPTDSAARLEAGAVDEMAWQRLARADPGRLGEELRRLGRLAAWRDAFASHLSPIRLLQVLSLWLPQDEARLLAGLVARVQVGPAGDADGTGDASALPRRWLFDEVLLAPPDARDVARLLTAMLARQARYESRTRVAVTRALIDAWPADDGGPEPADRLRAALLEQISDLPDPGSQQAGSHDPEAPDRGASSSQVRHLSSEPPRRADTVDMAAHDPPAVARELMRQSAAVRLAQGRLDEASWDLLLTGDRAQFAESLVRLGAAESWRGDFAAVLPSTRLQSFLTLWLAAADAAFVAALSLGETGWGAGAGGLTVRQWLVEDLLTAPRGARDVGGLIENLVGQAARWEGRTFAAAAEELMASWPLEGRDAAVGDRLARLLASSTTATPGSGAPAGSATGAVTPTDAADTDGELDAADAVAPPDGGLDDRSWAQAIAGEIAVGLSPAWLGRLPALLSPGLRAMLEARLSPPAAGADWLSPLTEGQKRDLLVRLRPHAAPPALDLLDHLTSAWRRVEVAQAPDAQPSPPRVRADVAWVFLLDEFVASDRLFEVGGFVARWLAAITSGGPQAAALAWREALLEELTAPPAAARRIVAPDRGTDWAAVLARITIADADDVATDVEGGVEPGPADIWRDPARPAAAAGERLYVANAGLVLAGPYVTTLFDRLELTADGAFVDDAAAERAVHLLQFLADGGDPAPEHELVLNKLLCGLDLATPIGRDFIVSAREQEIIEGLLDVMIQRWTILGSTSRAGLRESFLQRQGALQDEAEAWRLTVEPRAFDMLLDQIPWGFQTLKLPWMPKVVHVDWR